MLFDVAEHMLEESEQILYESGGKWPCAVASVLRFIVPFQLVADEKLSAVRSVMYTYHPS